MAKNEQVRIDLVAQDKASDVIDDVADAAKDLEDLDPEIKVSADTGDAERDLKDVADTKLEIRADTSQAESAIGDVEGDARALSRLDAEIVLKAKIDAATRELKELRGDLKTTGEQADTTARQLDRVGGDADAAGGLQTRGNAIADLTGPLGEASGAASDFAGVFDGLGDIATDVGSKMGLSAKAAGVMSSAISGLGIAVAAGAALWTMFSEKQRKAREEAEKLAEAQRDINDALREQDYRKAAEQLVDAYGDAFDAAKDLKVGAGELTEYLTGQADAIPSLKRNWGELSVEQIEALAAITQAREGYLAANGTISEQDALLVTVTDTLRGTTKETGALGKTLLSTGGAAGSAGGDVTRFGKAAETARTKVDILGDGLDDLRGQLDFEQATLNFQESFAAAYEATQGGTELTAQQILDLKNDYLTVATEIGENPVEIASTLDRISAGDVGGVLWDTQAKINARPPVVIKASISLISGALGAALGAAARSGGVGGTSAAPAVVNVTQMIPRGWRGDVLGEAQSAARRSGGLYRKARR